MENQTFINISLSERITIGIFYAAVSSVALFLHVLALIAVFRTQGANKIAFNWIILNMSISECTLFMLYLFYAAPCAFSGRSIFGDVFNDMAGHLQEFAYFPTTYTTLLIAMNRAVCIGEFRLPVTDKSKFKWLFAILASTWIISISATTANMYLNLCWTTFDVHSYIFHHKCLDSSRAPISPTIMVDFGIIYGVALLYAFCVWKIWQKGRQVQVAKTVQNSFMAHQRRLLYIALCIWVPTAVNAVAFAVIPLILYGFAAAFSTSLTVLARFLITPITLLAFSQETRQNAWRMLSRKKNGIQKMENENIKSRQNNFSGKKVGNTDNNLPPCEQ